MWGIRRGSSDDFLDRPTDTRTHSGPDCGTYSGSKCNTFLATIHTAVKSAICSSNGHP